MAIQKPSKHRAIVRYFDAKMSQKRPYGQTCDAASPELHSYTAQAWNLNNYS